MTLIEKERLNLISIAHLWLWDHSVRKTDYFRNILRKMWRVVYPAKECIDALSSILILAGMPFLHILEEHLTVVSFKYFQFILK